MTISARGRNIEIGGLAFDEFHRRAADRAHHIVFADAFGHRLSGAKTQRLFPPDHAGDRHFLCALLLPGGDVLPDMLRTPHQNRDRLRPGDHAAINSDIRNIRHRILGDDSGIGEDVAAAIHAIPERRRELRNVDRLSR